MIYDTRFDFFYFEMSSQKSQFFISVTFWSNFAINELGNITI